MKELVLLVGPPGSGKSTFSKQISTHAYVNQDSMGKEQHRLIFQEHLKNHLSIIVDRMNFSKEQRNRYLVPAKEAGYKTRIIVLHESFETCFKRCTERQNHETIKTRRDARNALDFFFKKYERVEDNEADEVVRIWPKGDKPYAVVCDLDGTLCNIEHRLHFVRGEGRKDWKSFFNGIPGDSVNEWCRDILDRMHRSDDMAYSGSNRVGVPVLCSGRPDSHRKQTEEWLNGAGVRYDNLFMRSRSDFSSDDIVKEKLLDFEILTRYTPYFVIDDRSQVVKMWRKRGLICLQCADGNF